MLADQFSVCIFAKQIVHEQILGDDHIAFEPETVAAVAAVAAELGLVATGGSDYHGDTAPYAEAHAALHVPDRVAGAIHEAIEVAASSASRTMPGP